MKEFNDQADICEFRVSFIAENVQIVNLVCQCRAS